MATDLEKGKFLMGFEQMRNMAELRALSKLSLEQPLTKEQYVRFKELCNWSMGLPSIELI